MFIGIRDFHKNDTDQNVIIAMDMSQHVGFRPLTREKLCFSVLIFINYPDDHAGEIVNTLTQVATAGSGYGGPDGTRCVVTRTMDRNPPVLEFKSPCPADVKPICKKRIGNSMSAEFKTILTF